ncbi:DUF6308 family protein [Geodermatophilus sp. CPCC 205506]|uniref:DUF6308 family protein n=1 Tax=Geodermatophilus sp. CPCC 205506 TaxID=2936596 RepID=UPI003EEAC571
MCTLTIGGRTVDRGEARAFARRYLTEGVGWSYPSYDGFDAAGARGPLVDGDFLAPVLLNVRHLAVTTYENLQRVRPALQSALDDLPPDLSLLDARPADHRLLARLFAVLDGPGVGGVRGTVLSKVLHRKRPAFIPLYDERVRSVYQDGVDAPVPPEARSWADFSMLFAQAVRADLERELPFWEDLTSFAAGPPITPLRALDIVAWWAGAGPIDEE